MFFFFFFLMMFQNNLRVAQIPTKCDQANTKTHTRAYEFMSLWTQLASQANLVQSFILSCTSASDT